jgi:hypothetical protein
VPIVRSGEPGKAVEQLPRVAAPYVDEEFITAFGSRVDVLAARLAAGQANELELTRCTADEMAHHLIVDNAEDLYRDDALGAEWIDSLPHRPGDDGFFDVKDDLLQDLDIDVLFNPALDGAEDPESDIYRTEGYANLHPRDWYKLFLRQPPLVARRAARRAARQRGVPPAERRTDRMTHR